jgi:16S rRNA (adenine1518-N6/adenine1519-N6)-dimethyltransferase
MQYKFWAKKYLGQHFLVDKNILNKIIRAADLSKNDTVLEIGAGTGTLTKKLCEKAKKVIAVEIDKGMVEILKKSLEKEIKSKKLEIIEGDILKLNPKSEILISKSPPRRDSAEAGQIQNSKFKIVANIPYQITAPILEKFLTAEDKPKEMVLMVQKEVAQKICCQPPKMNRLGILVQFYGTPQIIGYVSKNCFRPRPMIDSALLKIAISEKFKVQDPRLFFDLVKKGFSQKRKQLKNIFNKEALISAMIRPDLRAEELKLEDWLRLYEYFKKN